MFLSACEEKKEYIIKRVDLKGKTLARAWELGLKRGEKVALVKKYYRGGGVITLSGGLVAVGGEVLSSIEVER